MGLQVCSSQALGMVAPLIKEGASVDTFSERRLGAAIVEVLRGGSWVRSSYWRLPLVSAGGVPDELLTNELRV